MLVEQIKLPVENPSERRFSPYANNGGTVVAAGGEGFVCAVSDTRMSSGYRILTRDSSKICILTPKTALISSGMQADMATLHRLMTSRVAVYRHKHRRYPSTESLAQLLSTELYYKRFFPYYVHNVIVGLDEQGNGAVYGYDVVGSHERLPYAAAGTGSSLMMSILDNQLMRGNQLTPDAALTKTDTIDLLKDAITSATERDIYTGDDAECLVIDASGVSVNKFSLKKD